MQPIPAPVPTRVYLPQGFPVRSRVGSGVTALLFLSLTASQDTELIGLLTFTPWAVVLLVALSVIMLCVALVLFDSVIRAAYLEGTVLVDRRIFGIRRRDLAWAPAVRLERKTFSWRFSAQDPHGTRWLRVRLRPEWSLPNPLIPLADAILAGPPRPEPAGREAWMAAQQLRQLAANPMSRVS